MSILRILYNLFILLIIPIALPIGYLVALKKKEEKNYFERFGFINFPEAPAKTVWFHCASVGEARSLKRLIATFKKLYPDSEFIISTTTATGRDVAMSELKLFFAFLLPIENFVAIPYIVQCMNVRAVVIIDTEIWPNFITGTSKHVPLYLVNARISDKSFGSYKKIGFLIKPLLNKFTHIYTKSEIDTERFAQLKGSNESITTLGNIKFGEFNTEVELTKIAHLEDRPFVLAASTHKGEEAFVIKAFKESGHSGRLVIAARHMNRNAECLELLKQEGFSPCYLSDFKSISDAVVIDSFGLLEALYKTADKIFIGGSIANVGGHNIFEALQFGRHISVGPKMHNFREIYEIAQKYQLVTTVTNEKELAHYYATPTQEGDFCGFENEITDSAEKRLMTFLKELNFVFTD